MQPVRRQLSATVCSWRGKKTCAHVAQRCLAAAARMQVAGFSWGMPLVGIAILALHRMLLASVSVAAMLFGKYKANCTPMLIDWCNASGTAGRCNAHPLADKNVLSAAKALLAKLQCRERAYLEDWGSVA